MVKGVVVSLLLAAAVAPSAAAAGSLPSVTSGARPGPDVLYAPPPRAPQLENTGVWRAEPILVSGASAYRDGEFPASDHLTVYTNDEFGPVADFLGEHRVVRDPPRVSYVVNSNEAHPEAGVVADHAYWLSRLRVRDAAADPAAEVDARSLGFGRGDPEPLGTETSLRTLEGGRKGPQPYRRSSQDWGRPPRVPKRDALELVAKNLASATIDMRRARLSCDVRLNVTTDGPLRLRLGGCGTARTFGP